MTGIVFFMLAGRVLQDKTYEHLNFERDYASYFPIAVTRLRHGGEETVALPQVQLDDTLLIHSQEIIPADGIVTRGNAVIDYSFVTGESQPVPKKTGELVYAGGRQVGGNLEMLVIKAVNQSYLTRLWNQDGKAAKTHYQNSFVHAVSRYFTWVVLAIALVTALYWWGHQPAKVWPSVTAVLIIACPCALLLANSFTNGHILGIAAANKLYLRNAQTIEQIASANQLVFDKTGTLTENGKTDITYHGEPLTQTLQKQVSALASQSGHALSKSLAAYLNPNTTTRVLGFVEVPGLGIEGIVDGNLLALGSRRYITGSDGTEPETAVYVSLEGRCLGRFVFGNHYRAGIFDMVRGLNRQYPVAVLSGDGDGEQATLQKALGTGVTLRFRQLPFDKLAAIKQWQHHGKKVIMVGDGLNDAGALNQADAGIAVSDNCNNFTPSSDAILEASSLNRLPQLIQLCKGNKAIVVGSFVISVFYNIIGLFFAVQGMLAPVVAAVLMPASSISIVLITYGASRLLAKWLGLRIHNA